MPRNNIWVVPKGEGWVVKRERSGETLGCFENRQAALDVGREIARHDRAELIWQRQDGQIEGRDHYGPGPPGAG